MEYHLPNIKQLPIFKATMNSDNYFVNIQSMRFILSSLNLRNNFNVINSGCCNLIVILLYELYAIAML